MSNWLQSKWVQYFAEYGGIAEIVITLSSACFGLYQLIRNRIRQKREERHFTGLVNPPKIKESNDQVALLIELTNNRPEEIYQIVKDSIPRQKRMKLLEKVLIQATPLPKAQEIPQTIQGSDFSLNYLYTNEECTAGRFITLTNERRMPQDTEGAKKYIEEFNNTLNHLFSILRNNGIHTLHIFYHGPMPLTAYIGAKCTSKFFTYYYHYQESGYFLLGSSDIVKKENI